MFQLHLRADVLPPGFAGQFWRALSIAFLYFICASISRLFIVLPQNIAAIWPPSGLLLAALLLTERQSWLTTLLVVGMANVLANIWTGAALAPSLGFAFANCAEAGLAATLVQSRVGLPVNLGRLRDVIGFAGWAAIGSNAVTALLGAAVPALAFGAPFWKTWRLWWTADALGMLLVGAAILYAAMQLRSLPLLHLGRVLEFSCMLGALIGVTAITFGVSSQSVTFPYRIFPLLLWASVRFGSLGALSGSIVLSAIALWNTTSGYGPFALTLPAVDGRILEAQSFLGIMTLSALVLAAVIRERQQARAALQQANERLEQRVAERTADLAAANQRLQHESSERQRAETFLRAVVQQLPSGVVIAESPSGKLLMNNEEAVRLMGHALHAITQYTDYYQYGALHPDGRPYDPAEYPIARAVLRHEVVQQEQMIYLRGDNTIAHFSVDAAPIRDTNGQIIAAVSIFQDISARVQAETALRESEARFAKIFYSNSTAMVISRLDDGQIIDINQRFLLLFGYQREAIVGQSSLLLNMWVHAEDRARAVAILREKGTLIDLEVDVRIADGTVRSVLLSTEELQLAGEVCLLTTIHDITERKRLELQLSRVQNMESIGQLAGGIAHDFNNLLTAIAGYADLVRFELPPESPALDDVDEIIRASDRAAALTRQLLAFARRQPMSPRAVNLNQVVEDVHKLLRRLVREDIEVVVRLTPTLLPVWVDPGQIEQVLLNLVVNARDAMPAGGRIMIETSNVNLDPRYAYGHLDVPAGQYVMLAVSDNGIGMSPEVQRRVFEPFFTTKAPGKGTGLGLATSYGIVKQHGGTIWIYSEEEHGTIVKVYLPQASDDIAQASADNSLASAPGGNETILLVEDEESVRQLAVRVLRSAGYNVLEASNGVEAIKLAHAYQPAIIHLLLTDMIMPQQGGPATAAQLRMLYPAIKVLFMSGYTDHPTLPHDPLAPENTILQKPFMPAELGQRVRQILDL